MQQDQFVSLALGFLILFAALPTPTSAQIDFFGTPVQKSEPAPKLSKPTATSRGKAKVIFFLAPGCGSCPEEAASIQRVLSRLGWQYQIEGIFRGDPVQVGKYLAELRSYPFNFEIGLDLDGKLTKQYRISSFPTVVIEAGGKRIVVTKASELEDKLK